MFHFQEVSMMDKLKQQFLGLTTHGYAIRDFISKQKKKAVLYGYLSMLLNLFLYVSIDPLGEFLFKIANAPSLPVIILHFIVQPLILASGITWFCIAVYLLLTPKKRVHGVILLLLFIGPVFRWKFRYMISYLKNKLLVFSR